MHDWYTITPANTEILLLQDPYTITPADIALILY